MSNEDKSAEHSASSLHSSAPSANARDSAGAVRVPPLEADGKRWKRASGDDRRGCQIAAKLSRRDLEGLERRAAESGRTLSGYVAELVSLHLRNDGSIP